MRRLWWYKFCIFGAKLLSFRFPDISNSYPCTWNKKKHLTHRILLATWTGWRNNGISSIDFFHWKIWQWRGGCTRAFWSCLADRKSSIAKAWSANASARNWRTGQKTGSSSSCIVKVFLLILLTLLTLSLKRSFSSRIWAFVASF